MNLPHVVAGDSARHPESPAKKQFSTLNKLSKSFQMLSLNFNGTQWPDTLQILVESHGESSITEVEDQPLGLLTNALTRIGWFSLFG